MSQLVTVFGADGRQGRSVVEGLLRDGNYSVRAVLNNNNNSKGSTEGDTETFQCDLSDKEAVSRAVCGSYGCFVLTKTEVSRTDALEKEVREGKNIADACALHKVRHVIVSTQLNTQRALGIVARNMVAKAEVEDYMRNIGLPVTGLIVPCYYQHLLDVFKPAKIGASEYEIAVPMGTHVWDLINVEDVGEVVRHVFNNTNQYLEKTLSLAGDKLTVKEIAAILSRQLAPRRFKDKQITVNEYQYLGFPWCRDFAVMFDFFCRTDQRYNVNSTRGINSSLQPFDEWVRVHADRICRVLDQSAVHDAAMFDWT